MVTTKTTHVHTLIVGGGISGLSTAYALEKRGYKDYLLVEAKKQLGGLCASTQVQGYTVDYGGHVLHLRTPQIIQWVKQLLPRNLQLHQRQAFIYTNGMKVPFPFQANLWALHPELRELCIQEMKRLPASPEVADNFEQWCLNHFGYTLYEAFFRPYNEKLWGRKLTELSCEWCSPFVPLPSPSQLVQSVAEPIHSVQGYNASFYYPKKGGIGSLMDALAKPLTHIRTQASLTRVDLASRTAWVNEQRIHFDHIVNTMALPLFIQLLEGAAALKQASKKLEAQTISVYHLAIARKVSSFSWIYCPDVAQPFYRVGLQNSFAPSSAPTQDCSLLYIELPGVVAQTPSTQKHIWDIVNNEDVKLFSMWQTIPNAYVIFNKARAVAVPFLLDELEKQHCYCIGRYGRWEYSFMERSLIQAEALAQKLVKLI